MPQDMKRREREVGNEMEKKEEMNWIKRLFNIIITYCLLRECNYVNFFSSRRHRRDVVLNNYRQQISAE